MPPPAATHSTAAAAIGAGVERRRALRAQSLERVGEARVGEHVALARDAVADPVLLARLRARPRDRREEVEDVRLLCVDLDARARERGGRATGSASGTDAYRRCASQIPAGVP